MPPARPGGGAGEAPRGKARDGKGQLDCGEETTPEDPLQREAGFPLRPPAAAVGRGHGSAGTLA